MNGKKTNLELKLEGSIQSLAWDKHFGVVLPTKMTEELAEETGIHIGDGMMNIYPQTEKPNTFNYVVKVSGNKDDDKVFYDSYLSQLILKVYRRNVKPKLLKWNEYGIRFQSKSIVLFKYRIMGLPLGKKLQLSGIPKLIKDSNDRILLACIRGIFDTDFSIIFQKSSSGIYNFPRIACVMTNKGIILDLLTILKENFSINVRSQFDKKAKSSNGNEIIYHKLIINGSEIEDLLRLVKPKNPHHISRYLVWKSFGSLEPKSTFSQRINKLTAEKIIKKPEELIRFF